MEIIRNLNDDLTATISIEVDKSDVAADVEKTLREYRRKANIPGFRPGNVPMGLMKKIYGNAVLIDELNKFVSKSLMDYLQNEKLDIIGDPLPSEKQEQIEVQTQDKYIFLFDVALKPDFEIKLSKRDKINKYSILIDDTLIDSTKSSYLRSYGEFIKVNKSNENSTLTVSLIQLNKDGEVLENGISVEKTSILISSIKDENIKKSLIGIEENTVIDIDIEKAFDGNKTEIATLLNKKKENIENELSLIFRMTVTEIKDFVNAELNQEFFDKAFGQGVVNSEEEFIDKIKADIIENYRPNIEYKLLADVKEKLISKTDIKLPEEFLKRWVKTINKELTDEQIENEFGHFVEEMKWSLIRNKIIEDNEIKVSQEEIRQEAANSLIQRFKMYGINDIPEVYLNKYIDEVLKKSDELEKILDSAYNKKVVEWVIEQVRVEDREITTEEFYELFK